jgi:hypothetical protein
MAERLWEAAVAATERPGARLVRLAVLNRAAGAAARAGLQVVAERYRGKADELVTEQQQAGGRTRADVETLAEVVRRLLQSE